ncbi:MAG: hypothetical protein LBB05_03035 [Puniceicoccales bacterium]|jgi:ankyrin repeat protein|nr:hypothetical protein [Puniceicoccales bacterium]
MVINKYKMVGSVLLTLGLWGNNVYGSVDADVVDALASQSQSKEEELQEAVTYAGLTERGLALDLAEVAKLIRLGANPACRDEEGQTLLHLAGCAAVLALPFSHPDVDINARDNKGNTALHGYATVFSECLLDTLGSGEEEIEVLLECGANPYLENEEGKIARQLVEEWVAVEEALPPEERNPNSEEALVIARKMIQMLRGAERTWAAAHSEWMAAHPECVVE